MHPFISENLILTVVRSNASKCSAAPVFCLLSGYKTHISVSERWQRSCNCYFPVPHETRLSTWKLVKLKEKAFDSQMWEAKLSTLWKWLYYGRVVLCMWQSRCWPLRFKNSSMTLANARLWLFAEVQMWKVDAHACVRRHQSWSIHRPWKGGLTNLQNTSTLGLIMLLP